MQKLEHKALLAWSMALIMIAQPMEGQEVTGPQTPSGKEVGEALRKLPVPQQSGRTQVGNHPLSRRSTPSHRDMSHVLAATYYSLQDGLAATLMLSNQGPHPMDVKIALFNLGGERFDVPAVTVAPNTVQSFELTDWVQSADASFQEGSIQVSYVGMDMELGGVLKLVDIKRSLIFDEELSEPMMGFASSRLEGVWWLRSPQTEVRVAVSNTTDMSVSVEVGVRGKHGKEISPEPLSLGGHQTRVLNSAELFGSQRNGLPKIGGITIKHSGPKGAVIARGLIQEPSAGFSNVVEFYDPQTAKSAKLTGAGLRIGRIGGQRLEQIAIARNIGDQAAILKGRLHYSLEAGKTGVLDIPELNLAPGDTDLVHITDLIRSSGLESISAAGLEFEYSSAPGSVVMAALSVGGDGNQVFRVPLVDAAAQMSSTGQYPWFIDRDNSTFVYITNATDQEQQYTMSISFEGGFYNLGIKTLAPGQTTAFDLRKLRDDKIPDAAGKTLPLKASHGQVHWSVRGPHNRELIGRAEQVDLATGISMTSACAICCPDSTNRVWIEGPGTVPVGLAFQASSWEEDRNCNGTIYPPYQTTNNWLWTSDDTRVASVDFGYVTADDSGSTVYRAHYWNQDWEWDEDHGGCFDFRTELDVGQDIHVQPQILGPSPAQGLIGTDIAVTIQGDGLSGATINAGPGISVTVNSSNGAQIQATFRISSSAPSGYHTITVTAHGETSNSANFYVQVPSRLTINAIHNSVLVNNGNVLDFYGNIVETNECGIYRDVQYNLVDQQGGNIIGGDFDLTESFANYSTSNPNTTIPPSQTFLQNTSIQLLADTQAYVSPSPSCPGSNDHEGFDQSFVITVPSQSTSHYPLSTIVRIDRGGYSGTGKVDITIKTP